MKEANVRWFYHDYRKGVCVILLVVKVQSIRQHFNQRWERAFTYCFPRTIRLATKSILRLHPSSLILTRSKEYTFVAVNSDILTIKSDPGRLKRQLCNENDPIQTLSCTLPFLPILPSVPVTLTFQCYPRRSSEVYLVSICVNFRAYSFRFQNPIPCRSCCSFARPSLYYEYLVGTSVRIHSTLIGA